MLITNWVDILVKNSADIKVQGKVALQNRTGMTSWGKIHQKFKCLLLIWANHHKLGPTKDTLLVAKTIGVWHFPMARLHF